MTPNPRRHVAILAPVACLLLVAACTQATLTPSPSPSASPAATASASIGPSTAPSGAATPTPAPTSTPTASPTLVADCAVKPQDGPLSSDRMTDVVITSTDAADVITFVFGKMSLPGPGGQPRGDLEIAKAPYTEAGSGHAIDMQGDHVLQLRFTHMSLSSDTGDLTYDGPGEFKPDLTALRHAVLFDMSEGQVGWYIGYDGPGCVTLGRAGNDVTIAFARS